MFGTISLDVGIEFSLAITPQMATVLLLVEAKKGDRSRPL